MIIIHIKSQAHGEHNIFIDGESFDKIKEYRWYIQKINNNYYAATRTKGKFVYMHRLIMDFPEKKYIDHKNGNGLDNRLENIRICTPLENQRNKKTQTNKKTSKYKGVFFNKKYNKFVSQINIRNKKIYLGYFENEKEAAIAYNESALKLYGEFAKLNEVS